MKNSNSEVVSYFAVGDKPMIKALRKIKTYAASPSGCYSLSIVIKSLVGKRKMKNDQRQQIICRMQSSMLFIGVRR